MREWRSKYQVKGRTKVQPPQRRSDLRARSTRARWINPNEELGLAVIVVIGIAGGLLAMLGRGRLLSSDYEADSRKIESIANGSRPDFIDSSFTPIAKIYEILGLAHHPLTASLLGYALSVVVILAALYWHGRRTATWGTAIYALGAFLLSGVYLGQYSKDVFLLPLVLIAIILPAKLYWDLLLLIAMGGAAYLFRDYWVLIAVAYVALRLVTIAQVRVRYLLIVTVCGAAVLGMAIYLFKGRDPNYYRTSVQGHLEAATFIQPVEPFSQPLGGTVDIVAQFLLFLLPFTLPITAGFAYVVIMLALSFVRISPLMAVRSEREWPSPSSVNGVALRRSLALFLAFSAVQALFEPDYGSVLRHLTPMLPLALTIFQTMPRPARRRPNRFGWSWSGK